MKVNLTAASRNELELSANEKGEIAGFWRGLWHGFIAPFALITSLFKENVGIYEGHNNGKWYNFGFILGLMIVFGGNKGANVQGIKPKKDSGDSGEK